MKKNVAGKIKKVEQPYTFYSHSTSIGYSHTSIGMSDIKLLDSD